MADTNIYDMADTWNNGATTFTAIKMDVTNTASASGSLLMDLHLDGASIFSLRKDGYLVQTYPSAPTTYIASVLVDCEHVYNVSNIPEVQIGGYGMYMTNDRGITWTSSSTSAKGATIDTGLYRDGASGTLALRYGTQAETFRVYNTYTDASNYERLEIDWNTVSNVAIVGPRAAGTGSNREMRLLSSNTLQAGTPATDGTNFFSAANGSFRICQDSYYSWSNSNSNSSGSANCVIDRTADGIISIWRNTTFSSGNGGGLCFPDAGELTIATGAITVVGGYHTVDTQADDTTDDLDTINGGQNGMILVLQAENDARTVVVKDGTGNIQCAGDCSLDNAQDTITLIYSSALSAWCEIARSNNGT